jgi:hypothetical protein
MLDSQGAWRVVAVLYLMALSSVAGGGTESVFDLMIKDGWQGLGVRGTGARLSPPPHDNTYEASLRVEMQAV